MESTSGIVLTPVAGDGGADLSGYRENCAPLIDVRLIHRPMLLFGSEHPEYRWIVSGPISPESFTIPSVASRRNWWIGWGLQIIDAIEFIQIGLFSRFNHFLAFWEMGKECSFCIFWSYSAIIVANSATYKSSCNNVVCVVFARFLFGVCLRYFNVVVRRRCRISVVRVPPDFVALGKKFVSIERYCSRYSRFVIVHYRMQRTLFHRTLWAFSVCLNLQAPKRNAL